MRDDVIPTLQGCSGTTELRGRLVTGVACGYQGWRISLQLGKLCTFPRAVPSWRMGRMGPLDVTMTTAKEHVGWVRCGVFVGNDALTGIVNEYSEGSSVSLTIDYVAEIVRCSNASK